MFSGTPYLTRLGLVVREFGDKLDQTGREMRVELVDNEHRPLQLRQPGESLSALAIGSSAEDQPPFFGR